MFKQFLVPQEKYHIKCPFTMNPKGLCVHNTANDAPAINEANYMINNFNEVSFHMVVDDKEEIQTIPFNRNAWASGDGNGAGNRSYIHMEICYSKSGGDKFTKAEQRSIKAAADICRMYGWTSNNIKSHRDFSGKNCPHRTNIDWFKQAVQAELNGTTIPSGPITTPTVPTQVPSGKRFVHLKPHMESWAVYPLDKKPVKSNACGYLNPSAYGGLDYEILGNPQTDVYTISTLNFGKVNIYIPVDNDSNFYDKKVETAPPLDNRLYLNLHPHVPSWRVYPLNKSATIGNECGSLAPAQFSGLSYEIVENKGDVKVIHTQDFGKVQIYAPADNDSSITTSPKY